MLLNILIGKVGVDPQLRGPADFPKVPGLSPSTLGRAVTPVLEDLMLSSGLREHHRKIVHRNTYSQIDRHQGTVKERSVSVKCTTQSGWLNQKVILGHPKP